MQTQPKRQSRLLMKYGPWAIVTGASSGIGREMAIYLAEQGFNLILTARRQAILEKMAMDLSAQYGVETRVISLDLADPKAVDDLDEKTSDLDVGLLVAAAGYGTSGVFLDAILEQESNMLQVNCCAVLALSLAFGRRFSERRRGGIVLLSSILGFHGVPNASHYAATKAYVQSLAESLHVELKPLGVDVLASAPGPVHSGFASRANMQMGIALNSKNVAVSTLKALGKRDTVRPGWLSTLIPLSIAVLPRWAQVRAMGMIMQQMTQH